MPIDDEVLNRDFMTAWGGDLCSGRDLLENSPYRFANELILEYPLSEITDDGGLLDIWLAWERAYVEADQEGHLHQLIWVSPDEWREAFVRVGKKLLARIDAMCDYRAGSFQPGVKLDKNADFPHLVDRLGWLLQIGRPANGRVAAFDMFSLTAHGLHHLADVKRMLEVYKILRRAELEKELARFSISG